MLYLDFSHHSRLAPSKIMSRLFHVSDAAVRTVCKLWDSTLRSAVLDCKDLPLIKDGATHRGQCSCHLVISQKRTDLRRVRTRLGRSEEHTSELQSRGHLVCRPLLEKKNEKKRHTKSRTIFP